jgi:hypothetical protein
MARYLISFSAGVTATVTSRRRLAGGDPLAPEQDLRWQRP